MRERQVRAHAAADFRTIHLRHHPVENRESRRRGGAQVFPRVRAISNHGCAVVPALKRPREDFARHAIVFRNQYLHAPPESLGANGLPREAASNLWDVR